MHIHILGICGTFMGSLALLAKAQGHEVSGSDAGVYPPMSDQLAEAGIALCDGYHPDNLSPVPDLVLIGNAITRGNPELEAVLNQKLPYQSGPAFLTSTVLTKQTVLAVAGTHGKTTTASMLAWILQVAGLNPGYLIGGVPTNFSQSAALGGGDYFVIEADEYDTAYFDKRAKFIHYHPHTVILNNLEFDHADIYKNLDAIKQQFHFFVRTLAGDATVLYPEADKNLQEVIAMGCWSNTLKLGVNGEWQITALKKDHSEMNVAHHGKQVGTLQWPLIGKHNAQNALAAIAAAHTVGVEPATALEALSTFTGVKRRLEIKGIVNNITLYDDFAHHPTAIATTLAGLRQKVGQARILAVVEFGSFTMREGIHAKAVISALDAADQAFLLQPRGVNFSLQALSKASQTPTVICKNADDLIAQITKNTKSGDHILVMSNKGFANIHSRLLEKLG